MLVSYNLLTKYVDLPKGVTPAEVAEKLTMATVEVESVVEAGKALDKVVVGKVVKLVKHPNADKLTLADVEVGGKDAIRVVCGGTNLKEGILVALAKAGAHVRWHGEGDLVKLEKTKIRGEESSGMICSANEIGLLAMFPHEEMEIMDLSKLNLKVGDDLVEALGLDGVVFDIDNKSLTNRPDLWGHYGLARELSAIYGVELKEIEVDEGPVLQRSKTGDLEVEIKDKDLCSRYLGCVIENVKVGESPEWLKKELAAMGHNTFNNIVDITNYVMEEVGQPLHAFDKDKLGNKILIRRAKKGEEMTILDGETRELDDEILVIANEKESVALAAVMGGLASGVTDKTKAIVLEAANFEAMNVRRTSQMLNLRSDASMRFEKALDPSLAETGMRRALKLIKEILPEVKISQYIVEDGEWQPEAMGIKVPHDFLEKRIGIKLEQKEVVGILGRLGFGVGVSKGVYSVEVPSWRATGDVSIQEDMVEEVARIYGYDNLEEKQEIVELTTAKYQKEYDLENKVKNYLSAGSGMSEVFNYPWAEEKVMSKLGMKGEVEIANPPTEETGFLQTSLMPNIVKNVGDNLRFYDEFKIFELARIYVDKKSKWDEKAMDKLPGQPKYLAGAVAGDKDKDVFGEMKGIIEGLFKLFGLDLMEYLVKYSFKKQADLNYLKLENGLEGMIAEVKGNFRNKKVGVFEINFDKLVALAGEAEKKYKPLPQYPTIERDIAIEVENDKLWKDIQEEVEGIDKLVYSVEFLSEYPLEGKKSLAFRVVYMADRTLKDSEVVKVEKKILASLKKKFGAELRK